MSLFDEKENSAPKMFLKIPSRVQPSRVQPGRVKKGNNMASLLQRIESDDDAANNLGRKRKRRPVVDEQPEDMATVPNDSLNNPMAPLPSKKRKHPQGNEKLPTMIPMSLQAPMPVQTPWTEPGSLGTFFVCQMN